MDQRTEHAEATPLEQRTAISQRIDRNLVERRALFAEGAALDALCPENQRVTHPLMDIEAIAYGLGSCSSVVPRELTDELGRRWHLVLDPKAEQSSHGFSLFLDLAMPDGHPSPELLSLLRGTEKFGNLAAELPDIRSLVDARDGESTRVAVARVLGELRAGLHEVAAALFPECSPQITAMPAADAFAAMVGHARGMHRTLTEANAREQRAAVERDQARRERDEAKQRMGYRPLSSDQVIRLAFLLDCEKVPMDQLGDALIEAVERVITEGRERLEVQAKVKAVDRFPSLCPILHPATNATIRCSLLRGHKGDEHVNLAHDLVWRDPAAQLGTVVEDVTAAVSQLARFEERLAKLEGHMEHRAWTAITQRVAKLEALVDPEDGKRSNVMFGRIPSKVTREALDVMNHELGRINGRLDGAFSKLERDNARLTRDDARISALDKSVTLTHQALVRRCDELGTVIHDVLKRIVPEAGDASEKDEVREAARFAAMGLPIASSVSKAVMSSSGREILDLASLRVPTLEADGTAVLIAEGGRLVIANENGENVGVAQLATPMRRLLARMLVQSADVEEGLLSCDGCGSTILPNASRCARCADEGAGS